MTTPRELAIEKIGDKFMLTSMPVKEFNALDEQAVSEQNTDAATNNIFKKIQLTGPGKLKMAADTLKSFTITFSNAAGEKLMVGYDKPSNNYFIDRSKSGKISFETGFAARHTAPRLSGSQNLNMTIILDNASIELFADNGLSVMTEIFFPTENYTTVQLQSTEHLLLKTLQFNTMKNIWANSK